LYAYKNNCKNKLKKRKKTAQLGTNVLAPIVNSLPLDTMVREVTVVQQFMTKFNDAVLKEAKIQAISKTELTLMEQNGQ
jgi:hypothetical protein